MKICCRCLFNKEESEFFKNKTNKTGLRSECKLCSSHYRLNWYKKNLPRLKEKTQIPEVKERKRKNHQIWRHKNIKNCMITAAKRRAKNKDIDFVLTKDDFEIPEVCPILGIKLEISDGRFSDNSPSLDRFDNESGYFKDNVNVISYKANTLKNNGSFEEIEKLYLWLKEKRNKE